MEPVVSRLRLVAVYIGLLLPLIAYGAVNALKSSNNSPIDWVDSTFAERQHYDEFVQQFGPGDAVVASWPGCVLNDERLDDLLQSLRESGNFRVSEGVSPFHSIVCGRELVRQMTQPSHSASGSAQTEANADAEIRRQTARGGARAGIPYTEAVQRLRGTLVGKDGQQTCVVVTLNKAGLAERTTVVQNLKSTIVRTFGIADEDIHLAGPVIDGLTVDEASHASLTKFAAPSALIILVVCWWSLRSFFSALVVFLTASFCQATLLAVIYYSGERLSALLIILPPLVQVLTVSGGVHLMNYYLDALQTLEPQKAAVEAFRKGWLPSVLSMGTTAMGTASLMVSELEPIRLFGVYGTIGVLLAGASVLTIIPSAMMLLGQRFARANSRGSASSVHAVMNMSSQSITVSDTDSEPQRLPQSAWFRLATFLNRRNRLCLFLLLGVMILTASGLPSLETSVRIETLFPDNSRIMQDYRWLEDNLGPLVPIEVLISFDEECRLNDRRRMDLLWRVNKVLLKHPDVQSATSALTFYPNMPAMRTLSAAVRSAVINKTVSLTRPVFETAGVLTQTPDGEVWRITAHVSALEPLDYGVILEELRTAIASETSKDVSAGHDAALRVPASDAGIRITTSGIMPLVHRIQGQLLTDLFSSLLSALGIITLTMTIVEAGVFNGLTAMLSSIFPIVITFGLMGLFSHAMDIGSVMTASIALGIAVDDTLHFLAFFRRRLNEPDASRFSAVLNAYEHCGRAMIQTSLSCGIGLMVFALSDFVPTSRFALMMAVLLILALLGDLLLLPALLLSPAGRLFQSAVRVHASERQPATDELPTGA